MGHRQNCVSGFEVVHLANNRCRGFNGGSPHADHSQIVDIHHRFHFALHGLPADIEKFMRSIRWIDMWVFLKGDDNVGMVGQCLRDTAMKVELDTDDSVWSDNLSYSLGQIALAIVIAICHHGAV